MSDTISPPPPVARGDHYERHGGLSLITVFNRDLGANVHKSEVVWLQKPLSGEMERKILSYLERGVSTIHLDGCIFTNAILSVNFDEGEYLAVYVLNREPFSKIELLVEKGWDITNRAIKDVRDDIGMHRERISWKEIWFELADLLSAKTLRGIYLANFKEGIPDNDYEISFGQKSRKEKLREVIESRRKLDREQRKANKK